MVSASFIKNQQQDRHVATVQRQMNESLELFSKFYFLKYAYINSNSVGEKLRQFNGFRLSPGLVLMGISLKEATTLLMISVSAASDRNEINAER
jgi:uncharacterized membrane protein